ncbi:cysteine hydrolase family protein [Vibrio maritimus]
MRQMDFFAEKGKMMKTTINALSYGTCFFACLIAGMQVHAGSTNPEPKSAQSDSYFTQDNETHYVQTHAHADFKRHNTALLVIDAQQGYIPDAPDFWPNIWYPDMPRPEANNYYQTKHQIARIAELTQAAADNNLRAKITYEGFEADHSPFITEIEQVLPEDTKRYYKAYFNATQEAEVKAGMEKLKEQGVHQIIVAGAETDVCVMQTVLGLRKLGFDVYLASDAVFSTELYTRPTFKRLQQAGVKLVKTQELIDAIEGEDKVVLSPRYNVKPRYNLFQADRGKMAAIFFNQDVANITQAEHDNKPAVDYRIRQWSEYAHYVLEPAMGAVTFHVSATGKDYSLELKAPESLQSVRNINQVISQMQAAGKNQAVISGVVSEQELLWATHKLVHAGIIPVLMEDNLMGKNVDPVNYLDKAYRLGAVPATYKMLGYEITEAVYNLDLSQEEVDAHGVLHQNTTQIIPELLPRLRQF